MLPGKRVRAQRFYSCDWRCGESIWRNALYHYQPFLDDGKVVGAHFHIECFHAAEREWNEGDALDGEEFLCPEKHIRGKTCAEMEQARAERMEGME